jgi:hypothetical protein
MSQLSAAERPKTDTEDSSKSPPSHERQDEPDTSEEREYTIDEEGIVDEPSDQSGPDFNADLDPSDAP